MLFTFAGSSHTKYTTYLLEFLTTFELESSEALRKTVLNSMLVNLSGKAGGFSAGDIIQEFFNRLLEAIIERKGADFGATFIRQVISQNLHHMNRVKSEMREGVGLAKRSGHHSDPHTNPEVKTLLHQYALHELHSRRPGRIMEEEDVDDFRRGWEVLANGKLKKWVASSVRSRSWRGKASEVSVEEDNTEEEEDEDEAANAEPQPRTFGSMHIENGCLVFETTDVDQILQDYIADETEDEESAGEEEEQDSNNEDEE
jgi:hypothetical protein